MPIEENKLILETKISKQHEELIIARNKLENLEVYHVIKKRIQTNKEEYLDGGDVLKKLNLSLNIF